MANITKREIIENVNGTDQLFQASEDYVSDSLWVFELLSTGDTNLRQQTDMGAGFFQIDPAPSAGSDLYLVYEIEGAGSELDLNEWDSANLFALSQAVSQINDSLILLDTAIQKRLPSSDFYKVIELMNARLDEYEASLLNSSN